jgi:hypothetical protein
VEALKKGGEYLLKTPQHSGLTFNSFTTELLENYLAQNADIYNIYCMKLTQKLITELTILRYVYGVQLIHYVSMWGQAPTPPILFYILLVYGQINIHCKY